MLSRKVMRIAENKNLEDAVYKWFLEQRSLGNPLSGPCVCEKAKMFAEKMGGLSEFKASNGWLRNFKAGRGNRDLDLSAEKLSADNNEADKFTTEFKIITKNYDHKFVHNACLLYTSRCV